MIAECRVNYRLWLSLPPKTSGNASSIETQEVRKGSTGRSRPPKHTYLFSYSDTAHDDRKTPVTYRGDHLLWAGLQLQRTLLMLQPSSPHRAAEASTRSIVPAIKLNALA